MIKIQDKRDCCGCAACEQSCPKHCIAMRLDSEGFLYPSADGESCIDCGLCERVCPVLHPYEEHEPLRVMAAINRDKAIRESSSSGGIFYLLASRVIRDGGVVFGARFDDGWQVLMDYTETIEGIHAFMGSKYVQARTGTSYADAKRFLGEGRRVLYSGTPCQIAGLHHYLRKPYDNLLAVEVVCHGVPSPLVWQKYLAETVCDIRRIVSLRFRDKREGWKRFNFALRYDEAGRTLEAHSFHGKNLFMRAFLSNLILRPSCEHCERGRSRADISLADYWGVQSFHPEMDDDRGTSLVLANTEKGRGVLDTLDFQFVLSTYANALKSNGGLSTHAVFHPKRERFFAGLQNSESLAALVNRQLRPTFKQLTRMVLSKSKHLVARLLNNVTGGGKPGCSRTQYSHTTYSDPPTGSLSLGGIKSVSFRDKSVGWKRYGMRIELEVIDPELNPTSSQ